MAGKSKVRVNDNRLRRFTKRLKSLTEGITVTVGVQGKEATEDYEDGPSVAQVARVHEFGYPEGNIPQRSYMRATYDENREKYRRLIVKGSRDTMLGKMKSRQGMFIAGETYRKDIIKRIKSNIPPPLKQATIDRKGSSVALIDTGMLVAAITTVVKVGGKPIVP